MTAPTVRALAVAALVAAAAPAYGQPTLPADARFTYDLFYRAGANGPLTQATSSSPIQYLPGQSLTVEVYLRQTTGGGNVLSADFDGGLFSAGVRLTFGQPTGVRGVLTTDADRVRINTSTTSSGFNDVSGSLDTVQANQDFASFEALARGVTASRPLGAVAAADGRVFLGAVDFDTTTAQPGVTTLVASTVPGRIDTVTYRNAIELDSLDSTNPITNRIDPFTVQVIPAVPEPAGLLAAGAAAVGVWRVRRRRAAGRR